MDNSKNSLKTKGIALNGILLGLTVLTLFVRMLLPTNKLSLYALSSFFIAIVIIESGIKSGWVFYFTSCLLTLIIIPDKIGVIPYVLFFGIYGIFKFYIEKINKIIVEYVLKFVYFNICLIIGILFFKELILNGNEIKFPLWIIILTLEIIFFIYDYVYTLFLRYYNEKLKRILKI